MLGKKTHHINVLTFVQKHEISFSLSRDFYYTAIEGEDMKRSNAQIYQIELLLTLDYLLNYTDENHPATQQDICRHANDFGLRYDSNSKNGNDVRRQRISDCLKFLMEINNRFPEEMPFVLQQNDSGKLYVEQKNYLSEEQIIKVLMAVINDKYISRQDADFLIERLLDSFSNKHNREHLKNQLEKEDKGVNKYKATVNKKIRLVDKAYQEGKCLLILEQRFMELDAKNDVRVYKNEDKPRKHFGFVDEERYCRVYKIKEFNNKPYAILIPLKGKGLIFDAIENLKFPTYLPEKKIVFEDFEENRDLNELFKSNNPLLARYYKSLDEYIAKQIMPKRGFSFKTSFYFDYRNLDWIKRSFEERFCIEMPVIKCNKFFVIEKENKRSILEIPRKNDKYAIECEALPKNASPRYGVVNIEINKSAFLDWIWNNPEIAKAIAVVTPDSVDRELGERALRLLLKYQKTLGDEYIQEALKKHSRFEQRWILFKSKKTQNKSERNVKKDNL